MGEKQNMTASSGHWRNCKTDEQIAETIFPFIYQALIQELTKNKSDQFAYCIQYFIIVLSQTDKLMFHAHKNKTFLLIKEVSLVIATFLSFPDFFLSQCQRKQPYLMTLGLGLQRHSIQLFLSQICTHIQNQQVFSITNNILKHVNTQFSPLKRKHGQKRRNHCHCLHMYKHQCF